MKVSEVRSKYLAFFEKRGHAIIPSAPIVPGNDSTTLFTSSGMQPLVPYLLGQPHPAGTRLVNSQKSVRTGDIDETGDNRHLTFFEMLGNWSLGDYFKQEQLPWLFEFLTSAEEGLGLDPQRLYVTVFAGDESLGIPKDDEAITLWKKLFAEKEIDAKDVVIGSEENGYVVGMQGGRIFAYDAKKNWWSRSGVPSAMPAGEPGGPDAETFYDFGTPHNTDYGPECHPNCDCGRFVEICNSVFMEYIKRDDGSFEKLAQRNVDFGGGLERLTATTLGSDDVFLADTLQSSITEIERLTNKSYADAESGSDEQKSFRIVADHVRAAVFISADDIYPSNTEAGYILRRLIRRAIRHLDKLGVESNTLADLASKVIDAYEDAYPEVGTKREQILAALTAEEQKFRRTLSQGIKEFEKIAKQANESGKYGVSGHDAFVLASSYGFPIEITDELAGERNIEVDIDGFRKEMDEHQAKSRTAAEGRFKGGLADHSEITVRYHTSHHLLLAALRKILGSNVHQRGSNITQERVRLDFSFDRKVTPEELAEAERMVNEKMEQALPVICTSMPKTEAEKLGAEHEFGVKYGDQVTVYSMGPGGATSEDPKFAESFSLEFCGGPHVQNTSELALPSQPTEELPETGVPKRFRIIKEESVAAGVRRIKAVLE